MTLLNDLLLWQSSISQFNTFPHNLTHFCPRAFSYTNFFQQYDQKLQDNETVMHEYQKKIKEYEEKLDIVNKENEQLRNSHKQAMDMIREMEAKLSFSQGIV